MGKRKLMKLGFIIMSKESDWTIVWYMLIGFLLGFGIGAIIVEIVSL